MLAFPAVLACDSSDSGTIQLVTGEETDTFSQSPVPTQIVVSADDGSGNLTTLATATYPTDSIDLGDQDETDVATIDVSAQDATGKTLVYGQSVPLQYGALAGVTLPIFVQRVGQNARIDQLGDSRPSPTLAILSDRFLIVGGGTDSTLSTTTQVYDFAQMQLLDSPPTLTHAAMSMPVIGTVGIPIDSNGAAYYDFSQDTSQELSAPSGFGFADVAGGQTVYDTSGDASDGMIYVVGGTRTTGSATAAVLQINPNDTSNASYPNGNMTWLTLSAPRLGASAAYVAGFGLVVGGGSATAAGLEFIAPGSSSGAQYSVPPDPSSGAGMTQLDQNHVLIAGGVNPDGSDAGVRALQLDCTASCSTSWGSLPKAVTGVSTFLFTDAQGFAVGNEPSSGTTHTYLLTSAGATEVPTKVGPSTRRSGPWCSSAARRTSSRSRSARELTDAWPSGRAVRYPCRVGDKRMLQTQFSVRATDLAESYRSTMGRYRVGPHGYVPDLTAPEGPSTGGGVQAMQHLRLVPPQPNLPTLVVGHVNQPQRQAELRTLEHVDAICRERFKQGAPLDPTQYQQFLQSAHGFLAACGMTVTFAGPPPELIARLAAPTPSMTPPSNAGRVVVGILGALLLLAVLGGAIAWYLLKS